MNKRIKLIKDLFLSLFYSGYSPKAPGTAGSVVALILGAPIVYYSQETLFLLSIFIALVAIKHIDIYEQRTQTHDDKSIVIDELVGVWLAMSIVGFGVWELILAFVFFRIFDIYKPSFIGRIDKEVKGGLGVVGDDALAGILAGIVSVLVLHIAQRILSFLA
ncbi:phosphatidylglycerophosphatase A [Helicobacter sp. MIT 21-1697]|uniref:phosphatidylglycerophosphatase A family protein n=1 Tax=Helicobacter sp. MIT 21-1697 TaxID=2993733 RepID=UPI00224ACC65|nr:phosphatidylglycerophosphatase A [Helicobacter sp. MIT 21-1697]MCX2717667.1 phosphatidylglycerophosphatase A [Helicobacter sp. MIT 21-1697]